MRDKGGHELKLTYLQIAESSLQRRLCPVLKDTYRRAGVQLNLVKVPFSRWLRLVRKHNFHMADVVWSFFGAQDLYQHYHCSQANGGSNYGSFCNPKVDTLLESIRRTLEPKKRTALERKLHRRLYEALPRHLPLQHRSDLLGAQAVARVHAKQRGVPMEPDVDWRGPLNRFWDGLLFWNQRIGRRGWIVVALCSAVALAALYAWGFPRRLGDPVGG